MAKVNICNVVVLDNPSPFLNPFQFLLKSLKQIMKHVVSVTIILLLQIQLCLRPFSISVNTSNRKSKKNEKMLFYTCLYQYYDAKSD